MNARTSGTQTRYTFLSWQPRRVVNRFLSFVPPRGAIQRPNRPDATSISRSRVACSEKFHPRINPSLRKWRKSSPEYRNTRLYLYRWLYLNTKIVSRRDDCYIYRTTMAYPLRIPRYLYFRTWPTSSSTGKRFRKNSTVRASTYDIVNLRRVDRPLKTKEPTCQTDRTGFRNFLPNESTFSSSIPRTIVDSSIFPYETLLER